MSVAILDVSVDELSQAEAKLAKVATHNAKLLGVRCNVCVPEDCASAYQAVAGAFPGKKISFLFNNGS